MTHLNLESSKVHCSQLSCPPRIGPLLAISYANMYLGPRESRFYDTLRSLPGDEIFQDSYLMGCTMVASAQGAYAAEFDRNGLRKCQPVSISGLPFALDHCVEER
jgi:hypothetical protein